MASANDLREAGSSLPAHASSAELGTPSAAPPSPMGLGGRTPLARDTAYLVRQAASAAERKIAPDCSGVDRFGTSRAGAGRAGGGRSDAGSSDAGSSDAGRAETADSETVGSGVDRRWDDRPWLVYLSVGAVTVVGCYIAAYCCFPAAAGCSGARVTVSCAAGAAVVGAMLVGLYLLRPAPWSPWLLIGISQLVYVGADLAVRASPYLPAPNAFPTIGDALHLVYYPVLLAGLLPIIRLHASAGDLPSLLDGLLATTGIAMLVYLYLVGPRLGGDLPAMVVVTALAVVIADLILLTVGIRLLLAAGRRPPVLGLLTAGLVAIVLADAGHALHKLGGGNSADGGLDGVWLAGNLALGAAVLHPTMARVAAPGRRPAGLGHLRLSALYLVSLVAPLVLVQRGGKADPSTAVVCALTMALSTALIMLRLRCAEVYQRRLANTDVLTGLCTRRFLETRLALATARLVPSGCGLALLLVDIDHFKSINDRYGHPTGDRALAEVALRLRAVARSDDVVARYGGEEFALLTTGVAQDELRALGERLRATIAATPVIVADGVPLTVTVSVGAAVVVTAPASAAELVDRADRALYAAKAAGRDCVVVATRAGCGRARPAAEGRPRPDGQPDGQLGARPVARPGSS